jgi:hypothetical protein
MSMLLFLDSPATLPVRTCVQSVRNIYQHVSCLIGTQQSNSKWTRGERHHVIVVVVIVVVVIVVVVIAVLIIIAIAGEAEAQADGRWRRDER